MTCREKLKLEHPENVGIHYTGGCCDCPYDYGYLPRDTCAKICMDYNLNAVNRCVKCWDQEIPEPNKNKKRSITTMATTKKTKEELLAEIKELKNQVEQLERAKKYQITADNVRGLYDSFINAGFTDEQAFELLNTCIQSTLRG